MKRAEALFGLLRFPLDTLAVLAALLFSYHLRETSRDLIPGVQILEPATTLPPIDIYIEHFVFPSLAIFLLTAGLLGLYTLSSTRSAWKEIGRIVLTTLLWLVSIMAWYFLVRKELFYSRMLLIHGTVFLIVFVGLARTAVVLLQRAFLRQGVGVYNAVSIGEQPIARIAQETLEREIHYEYLGHVHTLAELKHVLDRYAVDLVMQTDPSPKSSETLKLIDFCRSEHIGYAFLPPILTDVPHMLTVERLGLVPMIRFKPTPLDGWGHILKRGFDVVASFALITLLSPLFVLIGIAIIIDSGFPILYVSRRIGERGTSSIPVLKFRSMVQDADKLKQELTEKNERDDGPLFKLKNDPRITPLGRLLRRYDLDELPQLLNVLLGHMSLVGPRPHLPEEVDRYKPYERRVFAVKPGITGLSQVSGRSNLRFKEEVQLDLQYVEEWSPFIDLWILWRTIFVVFGRNGDS